MKFLYQITYAANFAHLSVNLNFVPQSIYHHKKIQVSNKPKNKKNRGNLYLTFETKINETLVNARSEANYNMLRNAMYARPRIHVFLHSEKDIKDTFFMLARELKEVKTSYSSDHFINYTCKLAKENIKNIKMLEELD